MAEFSSAERFPDLKIIDSPILGLKFFALVDVHLFSCGRIVTILVILMEVVL